MKLVPGGLWLCIVVEYMNGHIAAISALIEAAGDDQNIFDHLDKKAAFGL